MKIAVLVGPEFEDPEYTKPAQAFKDAGHKLVHIGMKKETVKGKHGTLVHIDEEAVKAKPSDYDALFIPGGHSPDNIRKDDGVIKFVREFLQQDKPVFAICHGPQVLITADAVEGRTMTAWQTVQKDLENAGAIVKDEAVVVDGTYVTSRQPEDIPQFIEKSLEMLKLMESPAPAREEATT